jgi:uncharacterized OsmC-like protein
MAQDSEIRAAQERIIEVYRRKPAMVFSSTRASGRVEEGLACRVSQGDKRAVLDLPPIMGGDDAGPTPGFFIRAGLVGCIAIGLKLTAAREGIALAAIDVDVDMDFDDGAMFGLGTNTAAPLETRVTITLTTQAPWASVTAMVERALAADPFFLAIRDAQKVTTSVVPAAT